MSMTFKIEGFQEVKKLLQDLPQAMQNRIALKAVTDGAKAIAYEAKRAAPYDVRGRLKKALTVRNKQRGRKTRVTAAAGVWGVDGRLAHLMEYGTGSRYVGTGKSVRDWYEIKPVKGKWLKWYDKRFRVVWKRRVMHPGARPHPFLGPTAKRLAPSVVRLMRDRMAEGITKEVARYERRSSRGSFAGNRK